MSKKLSYKGQIAIGLQEKIKLSTLNGKRGYRIKKLQCMPGRPGVDSGELIVKVYTKDQRGAIDSTVNFSEADLVGVAFYKSHANNVYSVSDTIIFDNEVFNQDIFVTMTDAEGGTDPGNYYIELETVELSSAQATQLTLKSLRAIFST
jgi:hypothetical protein